MSFAWNEEVNIVNFEWSMEAQNQSTAEDNEHGKD